MDLESVIQSEVSQKQKNEYCMLIHIYGICKNGIGDLFAKLKERHRYRKQTYGDQGRKRWWEELGG